MRSDENQVNLHVGGARAIFGYRPALNDCLLINRVHSTMHLRLFAPLHTPLSCGRHPLIDVDPQGGRNAVITVRITALTTESQSIHCTSRPRTSSGGLKSPQEMPLTRRWSIAGHAFTNPSELPQLHTPRVVSTRRLSVLQVSGAPHRGLGPLRKYLTRVVVASFHHDCHHPRSREVWKDLHRVCIYRILPACSHTSLTCIHHASCWGEDVFRFSRPTAKLLNTPTRRVVTSERRGALCVAGLIDLISCSSARRPPLLSHVAYV
ncbi:hypothetical protein C8Q72DRAFT_66943 [Fomitopsis betulina]|nr:hypothetical protein C8Q72DRAFT_66943 [Fomitopsis betulina]